MQRRTDRRVPSDSTIDFLVDDDAIAARGSLRNVSARGLGVARLEPKGERTFAKGDQVLVRFDLPTGRVVAQGRIQWVNVGQRELGLKIAPDTTSAATLGRFLDGDSGGAPN
jgi:hypothetical protein